MKTILLTLFPFLLLVNSTFAQEAKEILALDKAWEKARLESNVTFLDNLLAEEFVWVHNHASLIDGKKEVLDRANRIKSGQPDDTKNRIVKDQQVVILGQTAVVHGYTIVDRGPSPVTYHFIRTYSWVDGRFKLLANHTMAIPEGELK